MLSELIIGHRSLSIIGMCKNAGKTTVLNKIIEEMNKANVCLGITSIGRDGEGVDVVTHTHKPGIYVREGTLFATAEGMLKHCDVSLEILATCGIPTPLGEVVLLKARSDGHVQLAGPSITAQLKTIVQDFHAYGAELALVDGAISRKSLSAPTVCEATILSSGASYNRDIRVVVEDTAFAAKLLMLPLQQNWLESEIAQAAGGKYIVKTRTGEVLPGTQDIPLADFLRYKKCSSLASIYINRAVTGALLEPVIMAGIELDGVSIVVRDGSRILLAREHYEKLSRLGASFAVMEKMQLLAVTVNPVSAYGYHFDAKELLERMRAHIEVPILDVVGGDM